MCQKAFGQWLSSSIAPVRLSDNLFTISAGASNVIAAAGPDGVLLVNGGPADRSADLLKAVGDQFNGKPVQYLVNTDWHPEHTGSNETLGKAGVKIIAHENTKLYLSEDIYVDWQNKTYKRRPDHALPDQTFYTSGTLTFGGHRIQYAHLGQAHTDGDIYVYFPDANVLAAGDVLSVGKYPIPDYTTGGWLGGMIAANKTLIGVANEATRIIPGSGPIQTRADLEAQHDMLNAMMQRFVKLMRSGMGPDDIIASGPSKDFDEKWGNPERFVSNAYRSMWLHVRELGGIV
jgi:glyoxylase-like metal-dependent hydrolase (beta-lactamase superfamily II)